MGSLLLTPFATEPLALEAAPRWRGDVMTAASGDERVAFTELHPRLRRMQAMEARAP